MINTDTIKFQKLGKHSCRIFSLRGALYGIIKKARVGLYYRWVFVPAKVETFGDLCFTAKKLREIHDKLVECRKKHQVEDDEKNSYDYYVKQQKGEL